MENKMSIVSIFSNEVYYLLQKSIIFVVQF